MRPVLDLFGFDQTVAAVFAAVDYSGFAGFIIEIDEESVIEQIHAGDRFIEREAARVRWIWS